MYETHMQLYQRNITIDQREAVYKINFRIEKKFVGNSVYITDG